MKRIKNVIAWYPVVYTPNFFRFWSKLNGFKVVGVALPFLVLIDFYRPYWEAYLTSPHYPQVKWAEKNLKKVDKTINHECIHIAQMIDLLFIFFPVAYVTEYLYNRFFRKVQNKDGTWRRMGHNEAYRHISFEQEAYRNQQNFNYLQNRKRMAMYRL